MFLWHIVPTWHEIENRITHQMGYQGGATYRTQLNERAPPALSTSVVSTVSDLRSSKPSGKPAVY